VAEEKKDKSRLAIPQIFEYDSTVSLNLSPLRWIRGIAIAQARSKMLAPKVLHRDGNCVSKVAVPPVTYLEPNVEK
jgi:hypothetical protein